MSLKETDLYPYVRQWLLERSCVVKAEVRDIDVAALYLSDGSEELFIAVELKTRISLELLLQAVDRLDVADLVYIAVPLAGNAERIGKVKKLCRRLGIGMLVVNMRSVSPKAEEVVAPKQISLAPGQAGSPDEARLVARIASDSSGGRARKAAIREFLKRKTDVNSGGSRGVGLMTAYREQSLYILHLMNESGASTTKQLKAHGVDGSGRLLAANYYGWFVPHRSEEGKFYTVSEKGRAALQTYADVVAFLVRERSNRDGAL